MNPLALHPEVGGPKKLPIARVLIGDEEVGFVVFYRIFLVGCRNQSLC
jgi:hypothetical protein